jgi:hypothetical protein
MAMNFYTPYTGDPPKYEERINEFFQKHWECYIHSGMELNVDGGIFTLEDEQGTYESDTFGEREDEPQTEYEEYLEKIRPHDPHKNWFEEEPQTERS